MPNNLHMNLEIDTKNKSCYCYLDSKDEAAKLVVHKTSVILHQDGIKILADYDKSKKLIGIEIVEE